MQDFTGKELKVGDMVVYVKGVNDSSALDVGNITKIYSNDKECSVGSHTHVKSYRIMKLGD